MTDTGLLLRLPTESIAIRVVIASVAAVLLARLVLRAGLRVPRVRAVAAMVPAIALGTVVALFWSRSDLPSIWVPVDAVDALPIPVRDTYLTFAPMAAPILVGLWALIASTRIALRLRRVLVTRRRTLRAFRAGTAAPAGVHRIVSQLSEQMGVDTPPTAMVDGCAGGATIVGLRSPVLVIDRDLVARLDDLEIEGVLAHELAHVRRRDNLVATALGIVGDLFFFVPGGRWGLRRLHAERELAADSLAVEVTARPAALASGLLKVIDAGTVPAACAALMPKGTLVGRVQHLIDDREPAGRLRSGVELAAVALVVTAAVAAAAELPSTMANAGEREALGVVWSNVESGAGAADTPALQEARAMSVYRESRIDTTGDPVRRIAVIDDDPDIVRPETLRACAEGIVCPKRTADSYSLGLKPKPVVRMDQALMDRWQIEPVVSAAENLTFFWFHRVEALD